MHWLSFLTTRVMVLLSHLLTPIVITHKSNMTLHVATGAAFFTTYCGSLAGEIFNDKWQACEQTKGNGLW